MTEKAGKIMYETVMRHEGDMRVICNYDSKHFFSEMERQ